MPNFEGAEQGGNPADAAAQEPTDPAENHLHPQPHRELTWFDEEPKLNDPVLIAAFAGWNDAGDAASGAVEHLIDVWRARPLASIDPEGFYDFTQIRPHVALSAGGERMLEWPENDFYVATIPGTGRHAILLSGIEPQLRWRTFTSLCIDVATRCNVSTVVSLGALLADVPHTRPTPIYGTSDTMTATELELSTSTYEGPTGIVGVLHSACSAAGLGSASLWAAVPSYVPGASSPKAALALLERLGKLLNVGITIDTLLSESATYENQVTAYVEQDLDRTEWVSELEEHFDAEEEPTPEGLVEDIEQFLRDQRD